MLEMSGAAGYNIGTHSIQFCYIRGCPPFNFTAFISSLHLVRRLVYPNKVAFLSQSALLSGFWRGIPRVVILPPGRHL
jgi:hypothetical protein